MATAQLYTFIMDYMGGTYVSQYKSSDKEKAMMLWIENLPVEEIEDFTEADKGEIAKAGFKDEEACLLEGLTNVWHFIVTTSAGTAYVNMVFTAI